MSEWPTERISVVAEVTDYVANGSFESLRNNVTYRNEPDYAILVRLVDHNANWDGEFVYVDQASFDFLKKSSLSPGDIVIANVGANAGTVFRVPDLGQPMTLGPNAILCKPRDETKLVRRYLYYYLASAEGQNDIASIRSGSAQPKFNKTDFRALSVPVPPTPVQHNIAHILGTLDDKIELDRRMNETLEAMARAIFKSWFVDFDPVRAKASGEPPESICRRLGLTPDVLDLFPDSFQDSELGEIPEGWAVRSFGELCDRIAMGPFGSNIKTSNFVPQGVPVIRGGNLTDGFVDNRFVFLTEEKADQLRNSTARPGDIVITHRGTLGQVGLIPNDSRHPRYVVSQSQMVLSAKSESTTGRYLYEFLRSPIGQQALLANTSQVGVPAIAQPTTSVKAIRVTAPPVAVLRAYDLVTKSLFDHASVLARQSATLAMIRDALLPKLLSGEISVTDAERFIPRQAS